MPASASLRERVAPLRQGGLSARNALGGRATAVGADRSLSSRAWRHVLTTKSTQVRLAPHLSRAAKAVDQA